jgi:hypothetical protein
MVAVVTSWGSGPIGTGADFVPAGGDGLVGADELVGVIIGWGQCSGGGGAVTGAALWCENFDLANYSRWSMPYYPTTGCESNGFTSELAFSPAQSHKSRVLCSTADSHRGYGVLRFQGDSVLPAIVPSTGGIDAPNGVVVTMWKWLDAPYTFDSTRWLSLFTATHDCSNNWVQTLSVNIDDSSMRLKPVRVDGVQYAPNAPAMPLRQWVRITMYLNFHTGDLHIWQNGTKVCQAWFTRPSTRVCQFHFGLYASGPNSNVTLYEDNYSIVKLSQPMTNFALEPRFPGLITACGFTP